MWAAITKALLDEPIATIGFAVTWAASIVIFILSVFQRRQLRKEKVVDLIAEARVLTDQTKANLRRLEWECRRAMASKKSEMDKPTVEKYESIVSKCEINTAGLDTVLTGLDGFDIHDKSHKNLLAAKQHKDEAYRRLSRANETVEFTEKMFRDIGI